VTETDPNVTTTPEGETVVLEPGDEGYVEPQAGETGTVLDAQPMPPDAEPPPEPQDLTYQKEAGESDAEFLIRSRTVVESQSPTDIVPNTPQIRPFPVEAAVGEPAVEDTEEGPAPEPAPEPEPEPEAPPAEPEPAPSA